LILSYYFKTIKACFKAYISITSHIHLLEISSAIM
jgi:hypothetical protein